MIEIIGFKIAFVLFCFSVLKEEEVKEEKKMRNKRGKEKKREELGKRRKGRVTVKKDLIKFYFETEF
jgi:hypothetical protein